MNQDELSDRLWNFAARVGKIVDALPETRMGKHVAGLTAELLAKSRLVSAIDESEQLCRIVGKPVLTAKTRPSR